MKFATLTLDLGTKLGWALRRADGRIESGTQDFSPHGKEGEGARFLRFRAWLHGLKYRLEIQDEEIGLVVYERVDFIPRERTGPLAVHIWGGNWATVTAWAEHHQIPYRGVPVGTIKAQLCGNGRAKKPEIIKAVRARGFSPCNSDEADALAILLITPQQEAA